MQWAAPGFPSTNSGRVAFVRESHTTHTARTWRRGVEYGTCGRTYDEHIPTQQYPLNQPNQPSPNSWLSLQTSDISVRAYQDWPFLIFSASRSSIASACPI